MRICETALLLCVLLVNLRLLILRPSAPPPPGKCPEAEPPPPCPEAEDPPACQEAEEPLASPEAGKPLLGSKNPQPPFWGCGLLGVLPGIGVDGQLTADTKELIEGLKTTSSFNQVSIWNWGLEPIKTQPLTDNFLFMPAQWGIDPVEKDTLAYAKSKHESSRAHFGNIFLGTNEPDISGSCLNLMGQCTAPCLNKKPNCTADKADADGQCYCEAGATGAGFWPVLGLEEHQPLPACFDNGKEGCAAVVMKQWKKTAQIVADKGYEYLTTPLVAVNMSYLRSFVKEACTGCSEVRCGCPTHLAWHYYGNDCLSEGATRGYSHFELKLNQTLGIMEEFPHLQGAIVNEVGMLNCAMDTPDAICIPGGENQKYKALDQTDHTCPATPVLPHGMASFVDTLLQKANEKKYTTKDGRRAVVGFTWFNEDMTGGTYNLRLFTEDGKLNDLGRAYIESCNKWMRPPGKS